MSCQKKNPYFPNTYKNKTQLLTNSFNVSYYCNVGILPLIILNYN